jgi:hypothetical protein
MLCCLFPSSSRAVGVDLVFLGVLGNDAPAIEKSFDGRLREALSVNPEYHIIDYLTSQDFRRRIKFDDFPTVSRRLVEGLRDFSTDSTIYVWANVKSRSIVPVRRMLVKASALAEMTITLNMYSLRYKEYAFIGDVKSSAEKPEGFIFFYPLETGVHISAPDQVELNDKLVSAAAYRCADMISAVVKSEKQRVIFSSDTGGMSKYKAASISDMFNVPSVEGANVDRGRKRQTLTPAPAPTPAPAATPAPAPAAPAQSAAKPAAPGPAEKKTPAPGDKPVKPDSASAK